MVAGFSESGTRGVGKEAKAEHNQYVDRHNWKARMEYRKTFEPEIPSNVSLLDEKNRDEPEVKEAHEKAREALVVARGKLAEEGTAVIELMKSKVEKPADWPEDNNSYLVDKFGETAMDVALYNLPTEDEIMTAEVNFEGKKFAQRVPGGRSLFQVGAIMSGYARALDSATRELGESTTDAGKKMLSALKELEDQKF